MAAHSHSNTKERKLFFVLIVPLLYILCPQMDERPVTDSTLSIVFLSDNTLSPMVNETAKSIKSEQVEVAKEGQSNVNDIDRLDPWECWWRDRAEFFERRGYRLRPRYQPGWIPTWRTTNKHRLRCEDSVTQHVCHWKADIVIYD